MIRYAGDCKNILWKMVGGFGRKKWIGKKKDERIK